MRRSHKINKRKKKREIKALLRHLNIRSKYYQINSTDFMQRLRNITPAKGYQMQNKHTKHRYRGRHQKLRIQLKTIKNRASSMTISFTCTIWRYSFPISFSAFIFSCLVFSFVDQGGGGQVQQGHLHSRLLLRQREVS